MRTLGGCTLHQWAGHSWFCSKSQDPFPSCHRWGELLVLERDQPPTHISGSLLHSVLPGRCYQGFSWDGPSLSALCLHIAMPGCCGPKIWVRGTGDVRSPNLSHSPNQLPILNQYRWSPAWIRLSIPVQLLSVINLASLERSQGDGEVGRDMIWLSSHGIITIAKIINQLPFFKTRCSLCLALSLEGARDLEEHFAYLVS